MLVLNKISKTVRGKKILDSVSLRVSHGSIAVLLGPSGVGKSTLLRVLNNLESIDSGQVTLDGASLDLTKVNREHTVGMVFQHFNLFEHLSVLENITVPLIHVAKKQRTEAVKIAHALLEQYGISELQNRYPSALSGGQKQRVALARTLALKPKVICLDEPTSALDPLLTAHVAQVITALAAAQYVVLIATHDTTLVKKLSAKLCLMEQGKIIEEADRLAFELHKEKYPALAKFLQE